MKSSNKTIDDVNIFLIVKLLLSKIYISLAFAIIFLTIGYFYERSLTESYLGTLYLEENSDINSFGYDNLSNFLDNLSPKSAFINADDDEEDTADQVNIKNFLQLSFINEIENNKIIEKNILKYTNYFSNKNIEELSSAEQKELGEIRLAYKFNYPTKNNKLDKFKIEFYTSDKKISEKILKSVVKESNENVFNNLINLINVKLNIYQLETQSKNNILNFNIENSEKALKQYAENYLHKLKLNLDVAIKLNINSSDKTLDIENNLIDEFQITRGDVYTLIDSNLFDSRYYSRGIQALGEEINIIKNILDEKSFNKLNNVSTNLTSQINKNEFTLKEKIAQSKNFINILDLNSPDNKLYLIDLNKIEYTDLKFNLVFFYLAIGFAGFILGSFIILVRFGIQNYT